MSTPVDDKFPSKRFGQKLRTLRKKHNLTQIQLGEMVGVAGSFIARLEYGTKHPNVAMLLKLSYIFEVSLDVLAKDELELDA